MDKIKEETIEGEAELKWASNVTQCFDYIPIEYVTPEAIPNNTNSHKNSRAVIVQESELGDVYRDATEITIEEPMKIEPIDNIPSLWPSTRKNKCEICKCLGVESARNVMNTRDHQLNVCKKCFAKYLPKVVLETRFDTALEEKLDNTSNRLYELQVSHCAMVFL